MQLFNPSILMLLLVAGKPIIKSNALHKSEVPYGLLEELAPYLPPSVGDIVSVHNALDAYKCSRQRCAVQSGAKLEPLELLNTVRHHRQIPALDRMESLGEQASGIRNEAERIKKGDFSELLPSLLPKKLSDIMSKVEQMKGMMQMMSLFGNFGASESPKDASKLIGTLNADMQSRLRTMGQLRS